MSAALSLPTTSNLDAMVRIDIVEARLLSLGGEMAAPRGGSFTRAPVKHHFTPGLYTREIFMPAGSILTSKIHKTEHPFVVSKGRCFVYMGGSSWVSITAPHFGITYPGTRRLLVILEDTIWTTFHVTDLTDVGEIEDEIIEKRQNPLLPMMEDAA